MRALIESESETEFEYELAPKSNPVNACHFPLSNNHYFYVIKKKLLCCAFYSPNCCLGNLFNWKNRKKWGNCRTNWFLRHWAIDNNGGKLTDNLRCTAKPFGIVMPKRGDNGKSISLWKVCPLQGGIHLNAHKAEFMCGSDRKVNN